MEHTHLFCLPACGGTRPLGCYRFTQARRKKNAVPFLHRFPSTPLSRGCLHPGCFPLWCGREPTSLLNDYIHWAGAAPGTFAMLLVILCLKAGETYLLTRTDSYFICSNRYWTWHKTPTSPVHIRPFNTTSPTTARWFLLKLMCRTKNYAYTLRHQFLWLAHMILKAEFGSLTHLCHWEILYNRAIKIFSCPCWHSKSKSCKIQLFITWPKVLGSNLPAFWWICLAKEPSISSGNSPKYWILTPAMFVSDHFLFRKGLMGLYILFFHFESCSTV